MLQEYSINAVVGEFGSCKSLFITFIAWYAHKKGLSVFANYHLKGIPYTYIHIKDVATFPEDMRNCVVLLDEGHIGANAYDVFKKDVRDLEVFATQIRKRRAYIFYTTQRFKRIAKPLRDLTKYQWQMTALGNGHAWIEVYDQFDYDQFLNEFQFNGTPFFNMYDTEEIIKKE